VESIEIIVANNIKFVLRPGKDQAGHDLVLINRERRLDSGEWAKTEQRLALPSAEAQNTLFQMQRAAAIIQMQQDIDRQRRDLQQSAPDSEKGKEP
jgi:hypothetical protein